MPDLRGLPDGRSRTHRRRSLLAQGRITAGGGIFDFSRPGPELIDIGIMVREVVELLSPRAGITVDVMPEMPTVRTERVPLQHYSST